MIQEEKQLLLKDLCARLPYGLKCKDFVYDNEGNKIERIDTIECIIPQKGLYKYTKTDAYHNISRIKPYLRPMSSMTEEELSYYNNHLITPGITILEEDLSEYLDWMHSHHFDYRGLIEKGLALEAPEGMYKTE